MTTTKTDAELLTAWRAGDAAAGRALFERYFDPVSRFFANKVGSDHDDLVQETFAGCVGGRDRLRDAAAFRSYLFGIAYNVLKKHYRRKMGPEQAEALESCSVSDLAPGPSTLLRGSEQEHELLEVLRSIPLELQVVLEMHYWEGMDSQEIGEALGIPAGTVRSRMHRGRNKIGEALAGRAQLPGAHIELADLDQWAQRVRTRLDSQG